MLMGYLFTPCSCPFIAAEECRVLRHQWKSQRKREHGPFSWLPARIYLPALHFMQIDYHAPRGLDCSSWSEDVMQMGLSDWNLLKIYGEILPFWSETMPPFTSPPFASLSKIPRKTIFSTGLCWQGILRDWKSPFVYAICDLLLMDYCCRSIGHHHFCGMGRECNSRPGVGHLHPDLDWCLCWPHARFQDRVADTLQSQEHVCSSSHRICTCRHHQPCYLLAVLE